MRLDSLSHNTPIALSPVVEIRFVSREQHLRTLRRSWARGAANTEWISLKQMKICIRSRSFTLKAGHHICVARHAESSAMGSALYLCACVCVCFLVNVAGEDRNTVYFQPTQWGWSFRVRTFWPLFAFLHNSMIKFWGEGVNRGFWLRLGLGCRKEWKMNGS